jgi:glycine cleavage system protein P-like pyridoxal-binding family
VPYISTVVLQEIARAEASAAARMVREINRLAPIALEPTEASDETLDDYLDSLDAIKKQVAEQTRGMTARQAKAYFARAARRLQQATGQTVRVRRADRKRLTASR